MATVARQFRADGRFILVGGIALALAARLAHWVVADRVWEDALITLAHVRNAAEGKGLTHHPGEGLVHGFTSALSVLLPLPVEYILPGGGLTTMRMLSLIAGVVSVMAGFAIAQRLGAGMWGLAFVVAYLALDQLQIFFGMSGMETQVATAVLLAGMLSVLLGRPAVAGALAGLGVLARPDFAIWAILVLLWAASLGLRPLARAAATMAVVVAPWVAFTSLYYGSAIPQTIIAKGLIYSTDPGLGGSLVAWMEWLAMRGSQGILAVLTGFTPFFEDGVTVAAPLPAGVLAVAGLAFVGLALLGAWTTRRVAGWWAPLVYLAAFAGYWALLLPLGYFMWYQPPFLAAMAILAGVGIARLARRHPPVGLAAAVAMCAAFAMHLPWSIALDSVTQREIEDAVRRPAGEYLASKVAPGESVTSEAAGYLGWYGRVELWDFPGLTSPRGLAATRDLEREHRSVVNAAALLRPYWIVLRPHELDGLVTDHPDVAACYEQRATFGTAGPQVIAVDGLTRWNQDGAFIALRRATDCP